MYSISTPFLSIFDLIIIVLVKMTYTIFLEMFRGFWKLYWIFAQIWFLWIYDVIMTSWFANVLNFQAFSFNIWPYNDCIGKDDPYILHGNFPRIPKMVLNFCQNSILLDLWRHNDVMIVLIYSIFKPLFQYLVNLTIVKVKITHTIFLEIFRGFWKWYWNFA